MNNRELGAIAASLGHVGLSLHQRPNGRWWIECACGYRSTGRVRQADAIGAGKHHLMVVVREARASGVSLPRAAPVL